MKNILMVLAMTTIAYTGAEAQTNCTIVPKKSVTVQQVNTCKLVPKDVCTISPDRRSVTCYKTVDEQNLTPYGTQTSYYGPTGAIPGQKAKFETKTVIIKGDNTNQNYCRRDQDAKTTTCNFTGLRICRDANGYYSYCAVPEQTVKTTPHHNYAPITSKYTGNNSVVLK
jgi:hypothetical protein